MDKLVQREAEKGRATIQKWKAAISSHKTAYVLTESKKRGRNHIMWDAARK